MSTGHGANAVAVGSSDRAVPIIDIAPLFGDHAGSKQRVANQIAEACREVGFFCITGHQARAETAERVFAEAKRFFALPQAERMAVRVNRRHRGYLPQGITTQLRMDAQKADTSGRDGRAAKPNLSHSFIIGPELGADDQDVRAGTRLHGPNQWPAQVPELRTAMLAYQAELYRAGYALLRGFALALELPETALDSFYQKPLTHLRVLDYPPQENDGVQFGAAPHTDIGAITLLTQDGTPGLEVLTPDGHWVQAPAPVGALGVNCGDMMERWSNGRFQAAKHRVLNQAQGHRYSMVFLFDPTYQTTVQPLDAFVDDQNPARYGSVVWGEHFVRRLEATYDYEAA
jgi:isopenicillin N synthase-like dioxygenase